MRYILRLFGFCGHEWTNWSVPGPILEASQEHNTVGQKSVCTRCNRLRVKRVRVTS
jgi:hypothetical protein